MAVDEDDISTLYESIVEVLTDECDSLALHKYYSGQSGLDEQLWARAAELGWTAIGLPQAQGGLEMGVRGLTALFRALGRFAAPDIFLATLPAAQWLADMGDVSLCEQVLPGVITGEIQLAVPAAPDGAPIALVDGKLTGVSPMLIGSPRASIAILPTAGGFALMRMDTPEVTASSVEMWDRTRPMMTLRCDGAAPIAILSDPDGAAKGALFRYLALAIAADSVGGGQRIVAQTVEYLKTREQFGRPLASFQALKHRVADLVFALESADESVKQGVEVTAAADANAPLWVAIAKSAASEAYKMAAEDCLQLHGGVGYTWEFDCHIFLKRALLNQTIAGDNRQHRDIAAEALRAAAKAGISTAELAA